MRKPWTATTDALPGAGEECLCFGLYDREVLHAGSLWEKSAGMQKSFIFPLDTGGGTWYTLDV